MLDPDRARLEASKDTCSIIWVLLKGFNLNYHNKETRLSTIDAYSGNQPKGPKYLYGRM